MASVTFEKINKPLRGEMTVPADKSISHRSVLLGALCKNTFHIHNFLQAEDCLNTVKMLQAIGVDIISVGHDSLKLSGKGFKGFTEPADILNAGNSGTGLRLMAGLLAGAAIHATVTGDESLIKRPVDRIIHPLSLMGATCMAQQNNTLPPLTLIPSTLHPIRYELPVPSAQVKSAIMIAALFIEGSTSILEPVPSRNHTELMLKAMGADITLKDQTITVTGGKYLYTDDITIPADISSAAFFMVAGLLTKGSEITIKNVGINPTRTGLITVLHNMGANLTVNNPQISSGEPVADITVKYSVLKGTEISGDIIPLLIDEIPVIAVAAALAEGTTVIKDAQELRKKESDRLKAITSELSKLGADIQETEDGCIIQGRESLQGGCYCAGHKDHRIVMSTIIASLTTNSPVYIEGIEWINTSFPGFLDKLQELSR